jgi:hypothetical protein
MFELVLLLIEIGWLAGVLISLLVELFSLLITMKALIIVLSLTTKNVGCYLLLTLWIYGVLNTLRGQLRTLGFLWPGMKNLVPMVPLWSRSGLHIFTIYHIAVW